jgi:hypothetical protein
MGLSREVGQRVGLQKADLVEVELSIDAEGAAIAIVVAGFDDEVIWLDGNDLGDPALADAWNGQLLIDSDRVEARAIARGRVTTLRRVRRIRSLRPVRGLRVYISIIYTSVCRSIVALLILLDIFPS